MPETVIKDSETTYGMGENICKQCSQQRLISKMCKYLIQLNTKKKQTRVGEIVKYKLNEIALNMK